MELVWRYLFEYSMQLCALATIAAKTECRILALLSSSTLLLLLLSFRFYRVNLDLRPSHFHKSNDVCSSSLTEGATELSDYWLHFLKNEQAQERGYSEVAQLHEKCSSACSEALEKRRVVWIGGPPGSGKTTISRRLQNYGFTVNDCENIDASSKIERLAIFQNMTSLAQQYGTSAFAFGACFSEYLVSAPVGVDRVLLLPSEAVYLRRWKGRNEKDVQSHRAEEYASALALSKRRGSKIITILQSVDECVDKTILRICIGLKS